MAKAENCCNCVYSRWDRNLAVWTMSLGVPTLPACANQPDYPGRWKGCPLGRVCSNFRPRPPVPSGEAVKTISLGDGFVAYVDAADFEWLNQWTWRLCGRYAGRMEKGKLIFMHREIMQASEGMVVDHKNRNKVDNTRDNLRPFTHAENARNRSKPRGTTSQFRGVSHDKKADKYQAQIHYHGWGHYIGYFTDEIEAARAHDYKAVQLFGEAAQVNFPKEWPPERRAEVHAQGAAERRRLAARARKKQAAKKAPRQTPAAKRQTNSQRATGHESRVTKKARAETQGRRGGKGRTKAKAANPRATRDERRATKTKRATGHESRATAPKGRKRKAT